jgi:hypothetical protein
MPYVSTSFRKSEKLRVVLHPLKLKYFNKSYFEALLLDEQSDKFSCMFSCLLYNNEYAKWVIMMTLHY